MHATTRTVALAGLTSLVLAACMTEPVRQQLPICAAEVAGAEAVEAEGQDLPAELWYSILLRGFDRVEMSPGAEPQDCTGASTTLPTVPRLAPDAPELPSTHAGEVAGCEVGIEFAGEPLAPRPLTDADILINEGPDATSLVWARTNHYGDGDASGPVALVEWTRTGVAVRAIGIVHASPSKARMRIEGSEGRRVLVFESEECNEHARDQCRRVVRLLPIIDDRFATVPLVRETDGATPNSASERCLGDAAFALFEQHTVELPDGWIRRFEIVRSVNFETGAAVVSEHVVVRDQDPSQPDAPAQDFRQASSERVLHYQDGAFVTRASVWDHMIENYGSVAHDSSASAADGG